MTTFLEAVISGIAQGSIYALIGIGFVIVFKTTGVINFAQPVLMILGAYFVSAFAVDSGIAFALAVPLAVASTAAVGIAIERIAMRPMAGEPAFSAAIVTIGVFLVLQVVAAELVGVEQRQIGDPLGLAQLEIGDLAVRMMDLAAIITAVVIVAALEIFFRASRWGVAMRATSFDHEAALAQGVSIGRMFALAWALAAGLGAIAGIFIGSGGGGFEAATALVALKALPAIVLGGLDSIRGAIVGGAVIGVAERLTKEYQADHLAALGANFDQVVPYIVMLIVLLVRPYGLFGTKDVERV